MQRRLRYRDLVERGLVKNRPTLQNWIHKRGFPPGQLTGPNSRTWGEDDVDEWVASRPTAVKAPPPLRPGKRRGRPRTTATA